MSQVTVTHSEGLTGQMEASSGHSYQETLLALKPHVACTDKELVTLHPTPACLLDTWEEVTLGQGQTTPGDFPSFTAA